MWKVTEDRSTPLPDNQTNFLALPDSKTNLACFLSVQLILQASDNKTIIVSGGFNEEDTVNSSNSAMGVSALEAQHEDDDKTIVLHCKLTNTSSLILLARDTDFPVLLVAYFDRMAGNKLWMKSGTSGKPKYIPVHTICEKLSTLLEHLTSIIPFHAITGCDTLFNIVGMIRKQLGK